MGVRDSNEASWTQVVDVMEFMSDVTDIPILLDADTGYGNFNNARRLVRKLEQRNVAGNFRPVIQLKFIDIQVYIFLKYNNLSNFKT